MQEKIDVFAGWIPKRLQLQLIGILYSNLQVRYPMAHFPLSPDHRQICLQWCRAMPIGWHNQSVLFTDDCCFYLGTSDERTWIRRKRGERLFGASVINTLDKSQALWYKRDFL